MLSDYVTVSVTFRSNVSTTMQTDICSFLQRAMTSYLCVQDCIVRTHLTPFLYLPGSTADSGGDEGEKWWKLELCILRKLQLIFQ